MRLGKERIACGAHCYYTCRMKNELYQHIHLSPHLDDVAYSSGGNIYQLTQAGERVLVVSFFTASSPDDSLTPFTRELKERWGGDEDPYAVRRDEDLAAIHLLGADAVHLPILDCVYRQHPRTLEPLYPDVESIFADVHPAEERYHLELLQAFIRAVPDPSRAIIYAPLTAGHHVDHILVQRMACLLMQKYGCRVLLYEDFPYVDDGEKLRAALSRWPEEDCHALTTVLSEETLRVKIDAMACYASQVSTFWSNLDEMRAALRKQALAVGHGVYAERHWEVPLGRER